MFHIKNVRSEFKRGKNRKIWRYCTPKKMKASHKSLHYPFIHLRWSNHLMNTTVISDIFTIFLYSSWKYVHSTRCLNFSHLISLYSIEILFDARGIFRNHLHQHENMHMRPLLLCVNSVCFDGTKSTVAVWLEMRLKFQNNTQN